MDKKILEERIRQLIAIDRNAYEIYTNLARLAQTQKMKDAFLDLAADEKKHVKIEAEILSLVLS